jgi:toxin ParE1/3/4
MSSPEYRLLLSPKAEQDIENILRYTGETEGGRLSADLPDTYRLYAVASHVIVYRIKEPTVEVIRILHKRMSMSRQLKQ